MEGLPYPLMNKIGGRAVAPLAMVDGWERRELLAEKRGMEMFD